MSNLLPEEECIFKIFWEFWQICLDETKIEEESLGILSLVIVQKQICRKSLCNSFSS